MQDVFDNDGVTDFANVADFDGVAGIVYLRTDQGMGGTRSFFRKPFFWKFVMAPPQEVLGDERTNFGAYSILLG